ncbi:MAG: DUF418 domain-containing protein [Acidobacteria bacterium]|nr:DUF418 domain-containing protein [Acidobacteriota bacterium]
MSEVRDRSDEAAAAAVSVPGPFAAEPVPVLAPVAQAARVVEMDYVRGLAVLGILLVNVPLYNGPFGVYFGNETSGWFQGFWDQAALWFVRIFAEAKFYTLFSLLFGVGFGVQLTRATARRAPRFGRLYGRRLGVLLFLGLVHQYLFWVGDVLHVYALYGFILLLFRKRSPKTVLIWALGLMLIPAVGGAGYFTVQSLRGKLTPSAEAQRQLDRRIQMPVKLAQFDDVKRTYASGAWREVHLLRATQSVMRIPAELGWGLFEVLPMFLLGLWVARTGVVENLGQHLPLMRRLFQLGLAGAGLTLLVAAWHAELGPQPSIAQMFPFFVTSHVVVRPLHALWYATGIVLLVQQEAWRRRLAPLAAAGRMAATNYVGQTLICVALFYGAAFGPFGLGLFGRTGFAAGLALTFLVWAFQLWFSQWWLARHPYGPLEWLWRSLTYGRRQPVRLA